MSPYITPRPQHLCRAFVAEQVATGHPKVPFVVTVLTSGSKGDPPPAFSKGGSAGFRDCSGLRLLGCTLLLLHPDPAFGTAFAVPTRSYSMQLSLCMGMLSTMRDRQPEGCGFAKSGARTDPASIAGLMLKQHCFVDMGHVAAETSFPAGPSRIVLEGACHALTPLEASVRLNACGAAHLKSLPS
jgi:hypothetical protein